MGRAIVRQPAVYLMDEPLSNLDAKLRVQTRTEVVELQARLGVTTVYVTHDQVEAMTMGDRVAVLKDGVLQQCDAPGDALPRADQPVRGRLHRLAGDEPRRARGRAAAPDRRIPARARRRRARPRSRTPPAPSRSASVPRRCRSATGRSRAQIRTVEDLGSEVFVHLFLQHAGENLALVSKMAPPFDSEPGDAVGLQIIGTTHLFGGDGSRLGETNATFRQAPSEGDSVTRIS